MDCVSWVAEQEQEHYSEPPKAYKPVGEHVADVSWGTVRYSNAHSG